MASDDTLWFEMKVRDLVTGKLDDIKQKAGDLQKKLNDMKIGNTATRNAAELERAFDKIAQARKRISEAKIATADSNELKELGKIERQIKKIEKAFKDFKKNVKAGDDESLAKMSVAGAVKVLEEEHNLSLAIEQVNRKTRDILRGNSDAEKEAARDAQELANANKNLMASYNEVASAGQKTNTVLTQLQHQMAQYVSLYGMEHILKQVITIGGQFEYQHVALQNILGDIQQANTLFGQLQDLAIESPKTFMELTNYTKQLSAFQIPYEELFDTTKRLADLSSGLGVDMSRLILAYGQVRSAAVLRGQELRQFTEAGIPLVQKLAEEFTRLNGKVVTTGEVFELISKRAVPFEMVKKILWDMTNEGGQFYNMQAVLADTLYGKWQKLQDQWQITLGRIAEGKSLTGSFLKETIELMVKLVSAFDTILPVVGSIVAVRGLRSAGRSVSSFVNSNNGNVAIKNMEIAKQREIVRLERERLLYGKQLSDYEWKIVNSKGRLISEDYLLLAAEGKISDRKAYQLMMEGKMERKEFERLLIMKQYTAEQRAQIMNGNTQLLQGSQSLLSKGANGIWNFLGGWWGVGAAAIGAGMSIYDSMQQRAAEASDAAKQAAGEMTKDLGEVNALYDNLTQKKPKSANELTQAIEDITNALKDNGKYTDELQQKVEGTDDMTRKYTILYEELQKVSEEYLRMKDNLEAYLAIAYNAGNGLFSQNIKTNVKQWTEKDIEVLAAENGLRKWASTIKSVLLIIKQQEGVLQEWEKDYSWEKLLEGASRQQLLKLQNELMRRSLPAHSRNDADAKYWKDAAVALGKYRDLLPDLEQRFNDMLAGYKEFETAAQGIIMDWARGEGLSLDNLVEWDSKDVEKLRNKIESILSGFTFNTRTRNQFKSLFINDYPQAIKEMLTNVNADLDDGLSEWQRNIKQYFEENKINIPITAQTTLEEVEKQLQEKHKAFQEQMNRAKPILIKFGADFSNLEKSIDAIAAKNPGMAGFLRKAMGDYVEGKEGSEATDNAIKNLGFPPTKPTGSNADKQLKEWRERKKALDEYYRLFKEYSQYMSRSEAIKRINDTGLIKGQSLPDNIDDYVAIMRTFMAGISGSITTTERQSFWDSLVSDVNRKDFEQGTKAAADAMLKQLDEELKKQGKQWNLYKKIFEATGSREQASQIAFGGIVDFSNQVEQLRAELEKEIAGRGLSIDTLLGMDDKALADNNIPANSRIARLLKELKEASEQVNAEEVEKMVDAMKKLAGIDEQIAVAESKLADARKKYGDNSVQALALEKELTELRIKQLEESEPYLRFYSAIMNMTIEEAEAAGAAIKENLVKQLADGAINADKYLKSIKNVDTQLQKIRGKKGLFTAFMTGGVKGVLSAKGEVVDAEAADAAIVLQMTEKELLKARHELEIATKNGTAEERIAAAGRVKGLEIQREQDEQNLKEIQEKQNLLGLNAKQVESWNQVLTVMDKVLGTIDGVAKAFDQLSEMFDALGQEGRAAGWSDAADTLRAIASPFQSATNAAKSALSGDIGGTIAGTVGIVTAPVTAFAQLHDKKRERKLQESQKLVKALTVDYQNLQNAMESALGGVYTAGGYNEMLSDLNAQRAEIQRQYDIERSKKKSDGERLADYKQQLKELDEQIKNFALDMAKALYDIDLQSWARELTDAIVGAWENGEDAAEAYKNKVGELMKDLTKNILAKKVMERAFDQLGIDNLITNLMSGKNGKLDETVIPKLADALYMAGEMTTDAITQTLDQLESAGYIEKDGNAKSSSAGSSIKGVTEQTADLLAGYINAIRADVSVNRVTLQQILIAVQVQSAMPVIARAQLTQLEQIAGNTNRNANAADAIYSLLHRLAPDGTSIRVK